MASSTIIYSAPVNTSTIVGDGRTAKPVAVEGTAVVQDPSYLTNKIQTADYAIAKIVQSKRTVKVSQKLPFYVRFENIVVAGYGPANPAPIGIAIIGFSNYIL